MIWLPLQLDGESKAATKRLGDHAGLGVRLVHMALVDGWRRGRVCCDESKDLASRESHNPHHKDAPILM